MALKIAVERITAVYGNFGSFHGIFSNYCNKNLSLLLLWIVDKLETCLRISLVFFSRRKLRLNSSLRMI
jgi:abortive infection bacteriophage resistance protein